MHRAGDSDDDETNHAADVMDICWHWESNLPCCYSRAGN